MFKLPSLTKKYPLLLVIAVVVVYYFLIYLGSGTFHIGNAYNVPKTIVDELIQFTPWTVWIYIISYVYLFAPFVVTKDKEEIDKFLYSFISLSTVSCLIFFFFPTTVPRHEFVVAPDTFFLTKMSLEILRKLDVPFNCLPSLHVSTATLCYLFVARVKRQWHWGFLIMSVAISVSTMSTKQHHFYDCIAGFVLGVIFFRMFFNKSRATK